VSSPGVPQAIGVFVLDREGKDALPLRGWRGRIVFVGDSDAPAKMVAFKTGLDLGLVLEVHAVIKDADRTWVVLRDAIEYSEPDRS